MYYSVHMLSVISFSLLMLVSVPGTTQNSDTSLLNVDSWEQLTKDLDYPPIQTKKNKVPKSITPYETPLLNENASALFSVFLFLLGGVAMAILIASLLGWGKTKNKKVGKQPLYLTALEDNLPDSEVDPFLEKALADQNYRMAIRLLYLRCLQILARNKLIIWQKEKTNQQYYTETQQYPWHDTWTKLTRHYEKIYYGGRYIDASIYHTIAPDFESFSQQFRSSKQTLI